MTTNGSGWRRSDKGAARHISARRSPAGHIAPTRKISSAVLGPNPASIRRAGRKIFGSARVRLGVPGEGERGKESGKLNAFPQISSVTLSDNDFFSGEHHVSDKIRNRRTGNGWPVVAIRS